MLYGMTKVQGSCMYTFDEKTDHLVSSQWESEVHCLSCQAAEFYLKDFVN